MAKKWCDYSDLPADQCAHCRGLEPEPEEELASGIAWRAKYPGVCKRCGDGFDEGEWIREDISGHGYAHADVGDCA